MKRIATALLSLPVLMAFTPSPSSAKDIVLPADSYVTSHNQGLGLIGSCGTGCLTGLDYPGDWVEYSVMVAEFGTYETMVYVQGMENVDFHLRMTLTAEGSVDVQQFDLNFTGVGFG